MGDLVLHPTHWLFEQLAHPACPECQSEILPMTPVDIEPVADGKMIFRHAECAAAKPTEGIIMTNKQFAKRFLKIKDRIQKNREDLLELIDDATDILSSNDRACDALQEAADALSELL